MRLKTLTRDKDKTELAVRYQLVTENTNYILVHLRSEEEKSQDLPELQKIAQMQAAGWSGTESVEANSKDSGIADLRFSISRCESVSFSHSPAMYEIPALQRRNSAHNVDRLKAFLEENDSDDFYDIPAFLRVDSSSSSGNTENSYSEKIMGMLNTKKNKPKQLTPTEVIDIANFEIEKTDDITEFVKVMSTQKLPKELLDIISTLSNKHDTEGAWITILAWLLLCLENDVKWSTETKRSIEILTESLDSSDLNSSLQILNKQLFNLTQNDWV
jgi:Ca-activated chloride channel family protein